MEGVAGVLAEADVHPRPPRLVHDLLDVILVPDPHVLVAAVRAVEHSRNVLLLGRGGEIDCCCVVDRTGRLYSLFFKIVPPRGLLGSWAGGGVCWRGRWEWGGGDARRVLPCVESFDQRSTHPLFDGETMLLAPNADDTIRAKPEIRDEENGGNLISLVNTDRHGLCVVVAGLRQTSFHWPAG